MTIEAPVEPTSVPPVPPYLQFEACTLKTKFWTGFRRSKGKPPNKDRYNAQCSYCEGYFEGRKNAIRGHVDECSMMPPQKKYEYRQLNKEEEPETVPSTNAVAQPVQTQLKITQCTDRKLTEKEQKAANEQLAIAVIVNNISGRFLDSVEFRAFLNTLNSTYKPLSRWVFSNEVLFNLNDKAIIAKSGNFCHLPLLQ